MNSILDTLKKGELPEMPLSIKTESLINLGVIAVLSAIAIIAAAKLIKNL